MGLFDTVYLSAEVAAAWDLRCDACGRAPDADREWQTKSLEPCMNSYFLRHDDGGAVRLYLLDEPSDRRFWSPWTEAEIAESERLAAEREGLFAVLQKKAGEGRFLPDAYLPRNRRQRFMGELPHRWVEIHGTCPCGRSAERWIEFCDGVATEVRSAAPTRGPGFFDEAGGLER